MNDFHSNLHGTMVRNIIGCKRSFSLWKLQKWQTNLHGNASRIQVILPKEHSIVTTDDNPWIEAGNFGILERTTKSIQK
jgi:hypothetical protein